jgi:Protein of unknown function (DUF3551)
MGRREERVGMRKAIIALAAALSLSLAAGQSEAQYAPWCAVYHDAMAGESCGFVSLEHCRAEVRGIGGMCYPNPWHVAATVRRTKQSRTKRQR